MDKPTYAQALILADQGKLVRDIVSLEIFIDPHAKNCYFVVIDPRTGEKVIVDKFAKFIEVGGVPLPVLEIDKVRQFLDEFIKRLHRGLAGILSITDEGIVRELAGALDVDLSGIDSVREDLTGLSPIEQIVYMIQRFGSERSRNVTNVVEEVLLDGRVDLREWRRIYDSLRGK